MVAFSDGSDFALALADNSRTMGLAGVGIEAAFENGLSTYVDYDGALASGRTVHAITGGLRYSW
jgi:outer membrane autotransporter protein